MLPAIAHKPLCGNLDPKFVAIIDTLLAILATSLLARVNEFISKSSGSRYIIPTILTNLWSSTIGLLSAHYSQHIDAEVNRASDRIVSAFRGDDVDPTEFLACLERQTKTWIAGEIGQLKFSVKIRDCMIDSIKNGREAGLRDLDELARMLLVSRSETEVSEAMRRAAGKNPFKLVEANH